MGESSICSPDPNKLAHKDADADASLFPRRIHFHPARKPYTAFTTTNPNFHLQTLNPNKPAPTPSATTTTTEITLRAKSSDPFEHGGFDPELCFGITVRRIGAGLENLGNTCFLNSVLQCLTYTEPFAAYLQSGKHKSSCHTAGFCAMCAIQNHVKRALQSTGRILAPKDLVVNLRCISRNFRNARQEDAHEYMVNLLESMHKCCLPSGVPSESPSAYEKSLVHRIFGGRLRSQVKCMQCSYCSDTFDPFLDLSLEINKADSLHKALTHFTAVEQLDGGQRQYQCQRCKQKVKALKQLTVHKAPFVLSVHLKRFGSHIPGQKIDKKVEFAPTLDLKPFVSGSYEGNLKYTLYGVLVHAGWSTHSGHYYCFVRTSSGMWHNLDDNRVVQVSEKTVLQQKAYMLFYVRDRQSVAPRKSIDHKENSLPRVIKDMENCVPSKVKLVQNGPASTGLCTSDLSKRTQLENSSAGKITTGSVVMAANCSQLKDSVSQPSSRALVNGCVVQSTNAPSLEVHSQSVLSLVNRSNPSSRPVAATSGTKTDLEHLHQGSNSVHVPPNLSGSQNSGPKKFVINDSTNTVDVTNTVRSVAEPPKSDAIRCQKKISARLSAESGSENNQKEAAVGVDLHQKTDSNGLASKSAKFAQLSGKSCKKSGKKEDDNHHSLQKVLKPKKILKSRMTNMHLGAGFLMKVSLSLYKRKKQKRNKQKNSGLKSHNQVESSGDLEPSTSQKTRSTNLASTHSKKRPRKCTAEKGSGQMRSNDVHAFMEESVGAKQTFKEKSVIPEDNFKERIHQNNAVSGSNELPQNSSLSVSEENQFVRRESDASRLKRGVIENGLMSSNEKQSIPSGPGTSRSKRGLLENGLMSVFTRGLEEFTVARWDDTEPPSRDLVTKSGQSINIGYVPDEWDEEYDRGKRKKLRKPKDDFGGSNPFQEIASKKVKIEKKSKVDRFGSGNQPMRIR